jgi:UDP-N-acetylmuramoyl-L-alanyl-D-glutamate--2,6-diaminopimelate ligase
MRLDALLAETRALVILEPAEAGSVEITSVVHDTRDVVAGALYCCVPGENVDGHDLAADAATAGASALLVERTLDVPLPQLLARSVRDTMGPIADAFWDHPSEALTVVGITGTSGKTTTTHLLHSIFEAHGWSSSVLGTLSGPRTTPEAPELQAHLAAERLAGRAAIAMEVSSHALAMGRVAATRFAVAVFTNLSHDHLDFHKDLEDYFETKATLFTARYSDAAVVNLDDPHGAELARRDTVPTDGFSLRDARELTVSATSCTFGWRGHDVSLPFGGRFNVSNALAAATAAARLGVPEATIVAGLAQATPVPGRFEPVDEGQPFAVLVDYAHKPGALEGALAAARHASAEGRVIVVVGAGGDRDQSKRPEMGEVAARLADRVILTSDNPRSEDPLAIIEAMRDGVPATADVAVEPDRRLAIEQAVDEARPGDVVVIAGKGHEAIQIIGDRAIEHDDRQVARNALRALRGSGRW